MTDLEKMVDLVLGHACTMVCPYCAGGIEATKERTTWYHPDVLRRKLGHACQASTIRNADPVDIAHLVTSELQTKRSGIIVPAMKVGL